MLQVYLLQLPNKFIKESINYRPDIITLRYYKKMLLPGILQYLRQCFFKRAGGFSKPFWALQREHLYLYVTIIYLNHIH